MVDQQRFPPIYESPQLRAWRLSHLTTQNALARNGVELMQHYIASTACVPSRTSVFTGTYPSLHGASATDGAAKHAVEPDMFWLEPNTVPTMGNYFRAAGYRTFYKGKWHISHANLEIPGTQTPLKSYDDNGFPDPVTTQFYLDANPLDGFGFDGWIGPEPHSPSSRDSGSSSGVGLSGRDVIFAQQAVEQIQALNADRRNNEPWLLVASFTDPHDICLVGTTTWFSTSSATVLAKTRGARPLHLMRSRTTRTSRTSCSSHVCSARRSPITCA